MKLIKVLLIIIFFLGLSLRLFNLSKLPAILNRDEAALAYNAHLIMESGQDEWQTKFPLTFKSFGDYKLPGYIYLLATLFNFLPESDFIVRLPSALAGSFLIILSFFFAKDVLRVKKASALISSLFIAVSPVFFFYSRIAFEANVALFLFVLSLYLLLKKKPSYLIAIASMLLAVLTYNTPLLLLPFVIFVFIYKTGFKEIKKWVYPVLFLSLIFIWSMMNFYSLASQKSAITIFSDPSVWEKFALYRSNFDGFWQLLFGNKYVFYAQIMWQNLLASFSLNFLVENGGSHPWHSLPGFGHIFYNVYFLAIFMLIDFIGKNFIAVKDKKFNKKHLTFILLLIFSLAPSIVTTDSPHATRSLFFFFMLICLATMFMDKLIIIFAKNKKMIFISLLLLLSIESVFYYKKYFSWYPENQPTTLFVNYQNLIKTTNDEYSNEKVAVIDGGGYQYILTAWYLKLTSEEFFATMKYQNPDNIKFYYGERLLNYHFIKNLEDRDDEEKIIISDKLGLIKYE